jgi:hypothetical protein
MSEAIALLTNAIKAIFSPTGAALAWALYLVSEALGSIPQVKANAVYQAVYGFLKWFYEKLKGKLPWQAS